MANVDGIKSSHETYIFVPKQCAQAAREFLSGERRFENHKEFIKSNIDEHGYSVLGIPITSYKLSQDKVQTDICTNIPNDNTANDTILCDRLALHIKVPSSSVRIKRIDVVNSCDRKFVQENGKQSQKRSQPQSAFKRLEYICSKITEELELVNDNDSINVPKHWELHNDLVLFPANSFKAILVGKNISLDHAKLAQMKLCNAICDILSVKRIAIKEPGGIKNDDFRSPGVSLLHGFQESQYSTWAQRTENGIIQTWDITKCMFSVGNISEKLRVASLSCQNENVVDLFAGIGYFVLPYLIHAKAKHVYACEWNPASVIALQRNLKLNKVPGSKYTILEGDNRLVCPKDIADRVNLGLIPSAEASYKAAIDALKSKSGGILHIHGNVRRQKRKQRISDESFNDVGIPSLAKDFVNLNSTTDTLATANQQIIFVASISVSDVKYREWKHWAWDTAQHIGKILVEKNANLNWKLTLSHLEHVKAFAPFVDHLVLDLECKPISID